MKERWKTYATEPDSGSVRDSALEKIKGFDDEEKKHENHRSDRAKVNVERTARCATRRFDELIKRNIDPC